MDPEKITMDFNNSRKLVFTTCNKVSESIDLKIHNNLNKDEQFEFRLQKILDNESLTEGQKSKAIYLLRLSRDKYNLIRNVGTRRICENCKNECLATLFCEHCVRNYLKANFSNWTSGNNDIDDLIQQCQLETIAPDGIIEWFPYENLRNIKYLAEGGCSVVYTADLIGGSYETWDSNKKKLLRFGRKELDDRSLFNIEVAQKVVLKKLGNLENANKRWREEMKHHLILGANNSSIVVRCYGLTKDPSDDNYILVLNRLSMDLRKYLQENHNKLNWEERMKIVRYIIGALVDIQRNNMIHRDLHSGNILFDELSQTFCISDLGFCGPMDKPLNSTYGNLPYLAPEVVKGDETTYASDIYSFGMLMWEISSGQPPFFNYKHSEPNLAIDIAKGMRPKIIPGTPLEYKEIMEECWDADPLRRPFFINLWYKIVVTKINTTNCYQSISKIVPETNNIVETSRSKVHNFENVPEPRNATEEEQEEFHSKCYNSNNDIQEASQTENNTEYDHSDELDEFKI